MNAIADAELYSDIDSDRLAQLLQVHRRRVLEAEQELEKRRVALRPFEDEIARREASR